MEHVKLREKIGYGLGDAASSMFWKLFTMYLLFFYTDVVGISAAVYNPQNEMFQRFKTKCSFLQNEAYLCKSFFLP